MNGVDISNYQSGIDLSAVRPDFVIGKLSEGTYFKDKSFDRFYADCKRLGIPIGAYVYSHATNAAEGRAEAEYALGLLSGRQLDLPVYLDIEGDILGSGGLTASALAFAETVKSKGYRAGTYASLSTYRSVLVLDALRDNGVSIWVAQWGVSQPSIECDVWQRAVGRIDGYGADIDLDVMFGDVIKAKEPKLYPADMSVLCRGFYGTQVTVWQRLLSASGYLEEDKITGVFDAHTELATKTYQRDRGLPADGIPGPKTYNA